MEVPFHQPFDILDRAQGHTQEGPQRRAVGDAATNDRRQCAKSKRLDWKIAHGPNASAVRAQVECEQRSVISAYAAGDVRDDPQDTRRHSPVQRHPLLGKARLNATVPDPEVAQVELSAIADPLCVDGDKQSDENRLVERLRNEIRNGPLMRLE